MSATTMPARSGSERRCAVCIADSTELRVRLPAGTSGRLSSSSRASVSLLSELGTAISLSHPAEEESADGDGAAVPRARSLLVQDVEAQEALHPLGYNTRQHR